MPTYEEKHLQRLIEIAAEFIDLTTEELSYQNISDYMLELSGAKHVVLKIKNVDEEVFITVAASGKKSKIETDVVVVELEKNKESIGNFTLTIEKDQSTYNKEIVGLYVAQVALLLVRIEALRICKKSRESLENIIEATQVGTWEWNVQTNKCIYNERWADIIGYTLEELLPLDKKQWGELIYPGDKEVIQNTIKDVFNQKAQYISMKYRIKHRDGHWVNVLDQGKVSSWTEDNEPLMVLGTHLDISRSERLKDEHERFFSISTDLLCIADMDGNLLSVNNSWETLLGYQPLHVKNRNFLDFVHPEDLESTQEIISKLNDHQEVSNFVVRYKYNDGKYHYMEWLAQPYDNFIYGSGRDITDKYERQREVEFLSFRDYLTGLYNRRYMEDATKRLDTSRNYPLSIMVVDINGLKLTNDAFDHKMGDRLIKAVGEIIKKTCRSDDIVGRVGGDEFLLLLPNTDYITAKNIQERMIDEARNTKDDSFIVSFAIGCAVKTMDSQDIREIEKTADKNMYRNKSKYGKLMRNETIETALSTVFQSDVVEQVHAERVSLYCGQIAEAMGLTEGEVEDAEISGVLHDIGKITIAMNIGASPHKLLKEEWEEVKRHPITGYNILKGADEYAHLAEAILYHHERLDRPEYPEGLREQEIPRLSKIIAVADAYEAMTSDRPYRKAKTVADAIKELREHSGTQFDPEIVEVFINKVIN